MIPLPTRRIARRQKRRFRGVERSARERNAKTRGIPVDWIAKAHENQTRIRSRRRGGSTGIGNTRLRHVLGVRAYAYTCAESRRRRMQSRLPFRKRSAMREIRCGFSARGGERGKGRMAIARGRNERRAFFSFSREREEGALLTETGNWSADSISRDNEMLPRRSTLSERSLWFLLNVVAIAQIVKARRVKSRGRKCERPLSRKLIEHSEER